MNINATLFVQMVVFFIGCWITMKFIWPPLMKAIEERQKKIAEGLAAADRGAEELGQARAKGKEIEAEARARATTIVADGEKFSSKLIEQAKTQARDDAENILSSAHAEAERQLQQARDQLRDQVAALAIAGAEKILRREVNAAAHAKMLDELKAKL